MFNEPQSVIYPTSNIQESRDFFTSVLGVEPYFAEKNYVGYSVNGYELGVFALADPANGPMTYWGVSNIEEAMDHLLRHGASEFEAIHEVGGGIKMANVRTPDGHQFGVIQNPLFGSDAAG